MSAVIPKDAWVAATAGVTSSPTARSAAKYLEVVKQFNVEKELRYKKRDVTGDAKDETFCNIFVWDVTRAMGAEIPHWIDDEGNPTRVGHGKELSANGTFDWLVLLGPKHSWEPADKRAAEMLARGGHPVVAAWKNPSGPGHIAMVIPDDPGLVTIAQAGLTNFERGSLSRGFGNKPVRFFASAPSEPLLKGVAP